MINNDNYVTPSSEYISLFMKLHRLKVWYYVHNETKISDSEYDKLERELIEMERVHPEWVTKYSPSQIVGYCPRFITHVLKRTERHLKKI